MLDTEYRFYLENQDKLAQEHLDKFLVIVGQEVVGVYDTPEEAYFESLKKYELGQFLIQKSETKENEAIYAFHSRVTF